MHRIGRIGPACALVALAFICWTFRAVAQDQSPPELAALMKTYNDGNFKDAYDGLRNLALAKETPSADLSRIIDTAISCLQRLNRVDEIDEFREATVTAHPNDWRLLMAVAQSYLGVDHHGFLIAGEFQRGQHRGGGKLMNASARDRVRALQLYLQGMKAAESAEDKVDPSQLLKQFADAIIFNNDGQQAWRLQSLTDLSTLPDYEEGWGYYGGQTQGAPVDAEGNPILYAVPASWDAAKNDGERWRWVLETMVEWHPARRNEERMLRAQFLRGQFGVETLADFGIWLRGDSADDPQNKTGAWALETLGDDETIARLSTGIKRFKLPDDQNFIKLYQAVADSTTPTGQVDFVLPAIRDLATTFANRRQYPRAADYWRMAIERDTNAEVRQNDQRQLDQIIGNWGQFENVMTQPAGQGASVEFRFRNAKRVEFLAHEINIRKLLDDVKAYLKSNPKQLDWQKINISEIGYRLVQEKQEQYVGQEVARWTLDLEPREKHFDRRLTVATPLQKSAAYLVTANVQGGNTSKIVLWLADTAIVRKPMPDKSFYYVADGVTGAPIPKANVEFFAYRQRHTGGNNYQVDTKNFAEQTNAEGQVFLSLPDNENDNQFGNFQWVATATTPDGRLAYLGFHNIWRAPYHDAQYNETKTFGITDRPVYRPGQTVDFKFWIRQAQYDTYEQPASEQSRFAHQAFAVEILNPKGEKVYTETLTSDNYGGIAGKFALLSDATLGMYHLQVVNRGGIAFRVEEYKKPEYQVTVDAPSEPVMLGEKITSTIRAKYYFGS
ncbi:MAG: MG2 domain-containing protein, partial [Pirellulales bacterium]